MKKILFFIAILSIVIGCKKSSYVAKFDKTPQERAADQIKLVSDALTSAENGWIATLPTQAGGGYAFYFNFDKEQNVTMYADLTDQSASTVGKSYYRVKQDIGTDLVFDSYNYISMLDDPNSAVLGGAAKVGFSSDIEFIYDRSTPDSLIFIGKKYRQPFKLVKATAAQKAIYEAAGYKTAINKLKSFFTTFQNPYIEIVSGGTVLKAGISINASNNLTSGKRVDFTGVLADGQTVSSSNTKFAFTLDGASLLGDGLIYQGVTFVKFVWKDAATLTVFDSTGKEYIVKSSPTPLVPLYQLWGSKYNQLFSEFKTIYPGTSTKGADILNFFHNNLTNGFTGYVFDYGNLTLIWSTVNKRLTLNARSNQGGPTLTGGWVTASTYSYTVDATGIFKFTLTSAPAGGYVTSNSSKLHLFLLANRVSFDYYVDGANVYGRMTSVEDPTIVMTFLLQ